MIRTSFSNGIRFILETAPEQLVCVDTEKTLKFYDFRHENEKKDADEKKAQIESIEAETCSVFNVADADKKGYLDQDDAQKMLQVVLTKFDEAFAALELCEQAEAVERLFEYMDSEKIGKITLREFKSTIIRAYNKKLPLGILEPVPVEEEAAL
jgi:Ca2+-binding EF-hand superfamily protein